MKSFRGGKLGTMLYNEFKAAEAQFTSKKKRSREYMVPVPYLFMWNRGSIKLEQNQNSAIVQ